MAATFLTAFASFASTNIDDIFVLMILYAQTQCSCTVKKQATENNR